jgi:M6 family metalloprotease-like protein
MKYMPSWHFVSAIALLFLSFFIMQKAVVPDIVTSEMSAQVVSFNGPKVISRAQTRLIELGLYDGKINSRLTLETKIALTKFQKENNLKQTGLLDAPTQKALLGIDLYPEKNPDLISGKLRKLEWEEFDEKNKKITTRKPAWYLEKDDGKLVSIDGKLIEEDLVDQKVSYNSKTKEVVSLSRSQEGVQKSSFETQSSQVRTVVFLAQFANSTPIPYTATQYRDLIFGSSVQSTLQSNTSLSKGGFNGYITRFFKEMTHNQVNISGNVYGWYNFPENGSFYYDPGYFHNCYLSVANIQEMINFFQVDISMYDRIVTVSNCQEYENLGGAAFGSSPNYTYNNFGIPLVRVVGHDDRLETTGTNGYIGYPGLVWNLIHELGHTFGLGHASSLDCGENTIATNCTNIEYGNPFDAMGGWGGRIFNFLQQRKAGWIEDSNILEISESGNYFINNLQKEDGIVGAKIYVPGIPYPIFAVEHRKARMFDSTLPSNVSNGLILYSLVKSNHQEWPPTESGLVWRLIDPHPTDSPIFDDVTGDAISANQPFHDGVFGVTINVTSVNKAGINFNVTYDPINNECYGEAASIEDIIDPEYLASSGGVFDNGEYKFGLFGSASSFEVRLHVLNNSDSVLCPNKRYVVTTENQFTSNTITNENTFGAGGTNEFFVIPQQNSYVGLFGNMSNYVESGDYALDFKIKDYYTNEEENYSVPVTLYEGCSGLTAADIIANAYLENDSLETAAYPESLEVSPGENFVARLNVSLPESHNCQLSAQVFSNLPYSWLANTNNTLSGLIFSGTSKAFHRNSKVPIGTPAGEYEFNFTLNSGAFSPSPVYNIKINVI